MKRKMIAMLLISALCMGTACADRVISDDKDKKEKRNKGDVEYGELIEPEANYNETEVEDAYLQFVFDIYGRCAQEADDGNMMISPASIMIAMEIANAGACGNTQDQITNTLFPGVETDEGLTFASDLVSRINETTGVDFRAANALWLNENNQVLANGLNDEYVDYCMDYFNAEVNNEPFTGATTNEINNWVYDNTNGMIPEILDELDPESAAVIVNAICFEGEWAEQFEDYQIDPNGQFTNSNGDIETVNMMSDTLENYYETEDATGFIRYYEGSEYAFLAMLPTDTSVNANEFASGLTAEDYAEFWNSRTNAYDVYIRMPEFTSDYTNDALVGILMDMGIEDAFDEDVADFSNIANADGDTLYIDSIIHKTHIEVDREGTSAAAATAIIMYDTASCEPMVTETREVYLDRPFAYAIVDVSTGTPVFIGTVNSVE